MKNNKDLAAVIKVGDYCDGSVARFAKEYVSRSIEFDGSVVYMAKYGSYDSRYDILLGPGDKGPNTGRGPTFKYENVNVLDLNLTGKDVPGSIGEGDLFHFVAEVDTYNRNSCLFFLTPVSTQAR
ncbi:MAG: DUF4839 domain-containing protein [Nocardioides sp.]